MSFLYGEKLEFSEVGLALRGIESEIDDFIADYYVSEEDRKIQYRKIHSEERADFVQALESLVENDKPLSDK